MSASRMSPVAVRGATAAVTTLALLLGGLVLAEPAQAATLTVTTTTDADANDACTDASVTTPANPVTLRNALCVASNAGGSSTITVPAGEYALTDGALVFGTQPGTSLVLEATGGRAEIVGDGSAQLLTLDPDLVGGIAVEIDGFSFRDGRDALYGGGAIIGGSFDAAEPDSLTINDSVFEDNRSTAGASAPGGAIQFIGGDLAVTDSLFFGNASGAGSGGAIYYEAAADGDALQVSGSSFTGNTVRAAGSVSAGGGAIAYDTAGLGTVSIEGTLFAANTVNSGDGTAAQGGALLQLRGPATVERNVFRGNGASNNGSAIAADSGALTAHFNSFTGNIPGSAVLAPTATGTLAHNWWGCNAGPGDAPCDSVSAPSLTTTPRLVFSASATDPVIEPSGSTELVASLRTDSAGGAVAASDLTAFDDTDVLFSAATPAGSSLDPASATFSGGEATTTFTAGSTAGVGGATATFGSVGTSAEVTVAAPPEFTGSTMASGLVGQAFSFTITATGYPVPEVSLQSGSLPDGLALSPSSNGSVTLSGVPEAGAAGTHLLTFTASAGGTPVSRLITLNIGERPSTGSPTSASVAAGDELDVTITVPGTPVPALEVLSGLPDGLTFTDNHDGTASITGIPDAPPGDYPFTIGATNIHGASPFGFLLTITGEPHFTSDDHTTFTVGEPGAFAIEVTAGHPVDEPVEISGEAPAWLSLTGAKGAQQLVGTPPQGSGGTVEIVLSTPGNDGAATQEFTLTVLEAPRVTSQPEDASALAGTDAVFTADAAGYPAPDVQWQRFASGSWHDIPDATSTELTLAAELDHDGARVRAVFTNDVGSTPSDEAVLRVGDVPVIAPVDDVEVLVGAPVSIEVTSTSSPASALSAAGVPAWLDFAGAPEGQVRLVGTPGIANAGTTTIRFTADNGFAQTVMDVVVTVVAAVPLPDELPDSVGGTLAGVPPTVEREETFTVSGSGYLPGSTVRLGIYPEAEQLTTVVADDGSFTAAVTVPADRATGSATIAAVGINTDGAVRVLSAGTQVIGAHAAAPSPTTATVREGEEVDVTITAEGSPAPAITASAALPEGLVLDDAGDGTARLHGTPSVSPGSYEFAVSAENGGDAAQSTFTLTVTSQPRFTSDDHATFTVGEEGSFEVTVANGYPTTSAVTLVDAPAWLELSGDAGSQRLTGTPPVGSGGTVDVTLSVEGVDGEVTQAFTLTIDEAPAISGQPSSDSVLEGTDASFTVAATGHPAPQLQWQRFDVGAWRDIPGAASTTLTISTTFADDGARFRAVASNGLGDAVSAEAVLTVGQTPAIDAPATRTVLAGSAVSIVVTSTGSPVSAITASGLPAWLTITDAGDGTATLTGTPAVDDAGTSTVTLTADNGFAETDATIELTVSAETALPEELPETADGALGGVPESVQRGQVVTVSGSGFLPGSTVHLGIYSTPTPLTTTTADAGGAFSAEITIPAEQSLGAHTIAASGISAEGGSWLLTAATTVVAPDPSGGAGADGGQGDGLGATGADPTLSIVLGGIALLAILAGAVLLIVRRRTRPDD
ncbi:putative Ig domain-containing protein [Microbacterium sp. NPDC055903]